MYERCVFPSVGEDDTRTARVILEEGSHVVHLSLRPDPMSMVAT